MTAEQRAKVAEFQRKHRIGLLTMLFTDMVGSTRLKQELGDLAAVRLIQAHHAAVRELLVGFSEAEEIATAGDSFFIVFAKPSDASRFALRLQVRLRSLGSALGRPLLDRLGIHIGEVVIEEHEDRSKDLYGMQVDTCARVMSLAEGGHILLTRAAFDNARQVLKCQDIEEVGALSWVSHGLYWLKGVEEPVEICEVREVSAGAPKMPTDSEKARRHVSADTEPVLGWRPALEQAVPGTSWVLQEKLGEGGFGEVWVARHQALKERRVFKFCFRADWVRSLKREVTLFRVLKERVGEHPGIVPVREVYFEQPPYYLEMDYIAGQDLRKWFTVRGGAAKVPLETRLEIVAQAAEALQAAHDAGVIHRDVKPSNLLISDGPGGGGVVETRLTDFGIGQVVSEEVLRGMTRLGFTETMRSPGSSAPSGTYMYIAPELVAGRPATSESDIYSLGVVLYQLVVGDLSRPLAPDWTEEIADPSLAEVLRRCFAGNPQRRFHRASQLAESLRSLAGRQAMLARRVGIWAMRHPWLITGMASVTVLGLIGLVFGLWEENRALLWRHEHPLQVRPYRVGLFESLWMGSTVFIVSFGLAVLACADFLDRKRRRFRLGRPQLLAYAVIGAAQLVFGLFLLLKYVQARTWGLALVWYRYLGLVLVIAIPLCWLGLFLLWEVLRERYRLFFGLPPEAEVETVVLPSPGRAAGTWVLLVESLLIYGVATFLCKDPLSRLIFTFVAATSTTLVWSFAAYCRHRSAERHIWLFLSALEVALLAMCVYVYPAVLSLGGLALGLAGGFGLMKVAGLNAWHGSR